MFSGPGLPGQKTIKRVPKTIKNDQKQYQSDQKQSKTTQAPPSAAPRGRFAPPGVSFLIVFGRFGIDFDHFCLFGDPFDCSLAPTCRAGKQSNVSPKQSKMIKNNTKATANNQKRHRRRLRRRPGGASRPRECHF